MESVSNVSYRMGGMGTVRAVVSGAFLGNDKRSPTVQQLHRQALHAVLSEAASLKTQLNQKEVSK